PLRHACTKIVIGHRRDPGYAPLCLPPSGGTVDRAIGRQPYYDSAGAERARSPVLPRCDIVSSQMHGMRSWMVWGSVVIGSLAIAAALATTVTRRTQRVVVLGINVADDYDDAAVFLKKLAITYPSVFDPEQTRLTAYGVTGLPTTFFLDPRMQLRDKVPGGYVGPDGYQRLHRQITGLLRQ